VVKEENDVVMEQWLNEMMTKYMCDVMIKWRGLRIVKTGGWTRRGWRKTV